MKIYSINNTNCFDKPRYYTSFKAIQQNLITDTFEQITNPKNKMVYEQLVKTFKDHKPIVGLGLKKSIENAYKACLDSNGEINDYALSTLYKLCYLKPDFGNPLTPVINIIHDKVLNPFSSFLESWDGESKILDKTERCRTYKEEGLWQIARMIEGCKDKNGNHNQINLDFANWIEKNRSVSDNDVLKFINACKDTKTGICREENIQIFKDLCRQNRHNWFIYLPNEDGIISETALDFLENSLTLLETKKEMLQEERYHYNTYIDIVRDALHHAHDKDRDEILKLVYENRDVLAKNLRGRINPLLDAADKIVTDSSFDTIKDYNISLTNLKTLIDCFKENLPQCILKNFYMLKDKNNIVNEHNKECIKILNNNIYYWWDSDFNDITKIKEARNEDGILNIDFCKKFAEIIKKHSKENEKPAATPLLICLEYLKNKDDLINWEAADIVFPILKAYINGRGIMSSKDKNTKDLLIKLSMLMRDENGDFCKTRMDKVKKAAEQYKNASYLNEDEMFADIEMQEVFETAKNINLFKAEEMYSFIKQLQSKGKLTAMHFSIPVDEDGNTLLMYIADIPCDAENEYEYEQIIKTLKSIPDIDYEQQDKFGITFLEKVINSENFELLNLMKNKKMTYNPMLDFAYNGVQNQDFKEELKKIKLKFPELEEAVKLNSTGAFEKVKAQLHSPFCNSKKEIEYLLDIATENKNFAILCFLKKLYINM